MAIGPTIPVSIANSNDAIVAYLLEVYPAFVNGRAKVLESKVQNILHGAVGVASEGGELLDAIKKCWAYNKPLDFKVEQNLIEECGDALFYIQHICNQLGINLLDLLKANMEKLIVRYPNGYSDAHALARLDKLNEAGQDGTPT